MSSSSTIVLTPCPSKNYTPRRRLATSLRFPRAFLPRVIVFWRLSKHFFDPPRIFSFRYKPLLRLHCLGLSSIDIWRLTSRVLPPGRPPPAQAVRHLLHSRATFGLIPQAAARVHLAALHIRRPLLLALSPRGLFRLAFTPLALRIPTGTIFDTSLCGPPIGQPRLFPVLWGASSSFSASWRASFTSS